MNDREYQKLTAAARRGAGRKYGFRQSSYINFKVEDGYFFCLFTFTDEVRLTVKPMYADELWWDIWKAPENKNAPLSLRGTGAYSLSAQIMGSYDIAGISDGSALTDRFEEIFQDSVNEISKFLKIHPDADKFFPDESRVDHDPDRLLYLMALIHNGREKEALAIIKEARRNKHRCMFQSGMFSDSYTCILRWCHRGLFSNRMRHAFESCFGAIVKTRAYALMALGSNKKDLLPGVWDIRLLDGGLISALFISTTFLCKKSTWVCIIMAVCFIFVYFTFAFFIDFGKSSTHYYVRFGKLPDRTRLRWKAGVWAVVILLYLYAFAILCVQAYS